MDTIIWAEQALTHTGWQQNVRIDVTDGIIRQVEAASPRAGTCTSILIPAPSNLHSHSFQRAMAGMTERRGPDPRDSFWTWRRLMYRFLKSLDPDDIEAIAAFVFMQMAEAGYAAVAEFHYLHHQPDGTPYELTGEMSQRICAASDTTKFGLTLLPVMYQYGGCDERPLGPGQIRFGNTPDSFARLVDDAQRGVTALPDDCTIGTAPHSMRAVSPSALASAVELARGGPVHIHVSEQAAEVEEVRIHHGATPPRWLLDNADVDERWCFIHGTQMTSDEIRTFCKTGAVTGLCPITEANLGDGIFDGKSLIDAGGEFGIGSDSNIRISLAEELRQLEYSQRLEYRERAVFADEQRSTGRVLLESAARGGARALHRNAGAIAPGKLADLASLDTNNVDLDNRDEDVAIDSYIFAANDAVIDNVWSAGRHIVKNGRHIEADTITSRYRQVMTDLTRII